MIIAAAADRVLDMLDLADGEEYSSTQARIHINQAIFELAEENEYGFNNVLSTYDLSTPEEDSEPSFWTAVPGRALLTDVLSTTWSQFGYIKYAWVSVAAIQEKFKQMSLIELLDKYGDDEGVPEAYALDGDYVYWRPVAPAGDDYTVRFYWTQVPTEAAEGEEPKLLAQVPYGVIYRACMVACVWTQDDTRVPMFGQLSKDSFQKYNTRYSMNNDGPRQMEEYNG